MEYCGPVAAETHQNKNRLALMEVLEEWVALDEEKAKCLLEVHRVVPIAAVEGPVPAFLQAYLEVNSLQYVINPDPKHNRVFGQMNGQVTVSSADLLAFISSAETDCDDLFASVCTHAAKVTQFGCTDEFAFSGNVRKRKQWFPYYCFMQTVLRRYLEAHSTAYRNGKVDLRLGGSAIKEHLSRNGAIALLGPITSLSPIVVNLNNDIIPSMKNDPSRMKDSADFVLLLPLQVIIDAASTYDVDSIRAYLSGTLEAHGFTPKFQSNVVDIEHHLSLFMYIVMEVMRTSEGDFSSLSQMRRVLSQPDLAIVVFMRSYSDANVFDISGGKRELGETQWDGIVRETHEEIFMDINNTHIHPLCADNISCFLSKPDDGFDWIGYFHHSFLYISLHKTCYTDIAGTAAEVPETILFDQLFEKAEKLANAREKSSYNKLGQAQMMRSGRGRGRGSHDNR